MAIMSLAYGLQRGDIVFIEGTEFEVLRLHAKGVEVRVGKTSTTANISRDKRVLVIGSIFPSRDEVIKKSVAEKM